MKNPSIQSVLCENFNQLAISRLHIFEVSINDYVLGDFGF